MTAEIKKEKVFERNVSKATKLLMREYHDLIILSRIIKRSRNKTVSSNKFLKIVRKRIASEGHIEDKFEHVLEVVESELAEFENDNQHAHDIIIRYLDERGEIIRNMWKHIRKYGSIETNNQVKEIEIEIDKIIDALVKYAPVLNELKKNIVDDILKLESFNVVMGKRVGDEKCVGSDGTFKRAVIILDEQNHITFLKTGLDNHQNLAGKYYTDPGRHSFWYNYEDGDLVLHPGASEDDKMWSAWKKSFRSSPHLKREIRKNINYFY